MPIIAGIRLNTMGNLVIYIAKVAVPLYNKNIIQTRRPYEKANPYGVYYQAVHGQPGI
jgi:hypothetical protein